MEGDIVITYASSLKITACPSGIEVGISITTTAMTKLKIPAAASLSAHTVKSGNAVTSSQDIAHVASTI